jgi:hypothetical protein
MGLHLLITGAPHAGTGYTSQLLVHAGVPCGHEDVYAIAGVREPGPWVAESSWIAAAYLQEIPAGITVVHQVRDPLPWVDSYARRLQIGVGDSLRVVDRILPGFSEGVRADPIGLTARLYVAWNQLVERSGRAQSRHHLEDLGSARLRRLGRLAGVEVTQEAAELALSRVPRNYNHHAGPVDWTPVSWKMLSRCEAGEELRELARAYGYDAPRVP